VDLLRLFEAHRLREHLAVRPELLQFVLPLRDLVVDLLHVRFGRLRE
jgi:hypothetical protein